MIADNLSIVKERIKKAAVKSKRSPDGITLVCVTKGRSLEEIEETVNCGVVDIGENKVQEAILKHKSLHPTPCTPHPIKWHLVGHLQTNKARDAVKIFALIHSVDSFKLAKEIDKEAAKLNKIQDILVEVNTSGEATKFGIKPEQLINLVKGIINLKNIKLLGLMTIAPIVSGQEQARPYFRRLRQLQGEVNNFLLTANRSPLTDLSMGMSQDYEVAVEEGATMVRIGTAIFEG